jgi:hypothetical protein
MARKLRTTISPESGVEGAQRTGRSYPHSLLFPGSTATYPAGVPCPAQAQLPEGLRWHDLVSDGAGNWIVRVKS